jgi:hypothetical protein
MLSIDLFATQFERRLHEGAVDDLEAHRIDDLNMRMLELLDRAKEPAYKKNPAALAGLKRQFQKIKAERDSYFKINPATGMNDTGTLGTVKGALDELGIPGNVPTEQIPGKEDLLKGKGRSYYEDQKKNSEPVDEYISMGSDKNFTEAEPYKNYRIYVRKKPFGTTGMYTAHTEIDRKEFMGKGPSQEEAVQDIRDRIDFVLNAQRKVTGSSTIDFNVKFATDLLADPKQTFYAKLENINGEPKLVIASADVASDPELLAAGDFKRSALRNQPDDQGGATPLPGIPLTAKGLRSGDWIANGRYTVGKETQDRDGNRVFDLTYHSTAHTKSDKLRLNQPAFTLGTAREVDEHGGGIGPRQHWQSMMPETALNPRDPQGDYKAKRRALHDLSLNKDVDQAAVLQRRLDLDREARARGLAETVADVKAGMADIYRRLAPKIERHRDSFLAGQLYDELENYAELHGAEREFKQMMAGARNRAHMEYDTNPGGFHNWFWFLPFEDEGVAEGTDDIKKRMSKLEALALAANRAGDDTKCKMYQQKIQALKQKLSQSMAEAEKEPTTRQELLNRVDKIQRMMSQERNPANLQILRKELEMLKQRYQHLKEDSAGSEAVEIAVIRRILVAHTDLIMKFGLDRVVAAIEEVAHDVGDVDEIGSSDVSGWVRQVQQILGVDA